MKIRRSYIIVLSPANGAYLVRDEEKDEIILSIDYENTDDMLDKLPSFEQLREDTQIITID